MKHDPETGWTFDGHMCLDGETTYFAHYFSIELPEGELRWVIELHNGEMGREAIFPRWTNPDNIYGFGGGMDIAHSYIPRDFITKRKERRVQIMGSEFPHYGPHRLPESVRIKARIAQLEKSEA